MQLSTPSRRIFRSVRAIGATAVIVALGIGLGACAEDSPAASAGGAAKADKDIVVAFANGSTDGGTYNGLEKTLTDTLALSGAKLLTYNNNGDSATTFQNVSTMIAEKPDVIIEVNPIADASTRLGQQLEASGIPCIAVNVPIPGCHFFNQDSAPLGKQLADEVAAEMTVRGWTADNTEVVLAGSAAFGALNDVLAEFYAPLSETVPGMEKVAVGDITTATETFGTNGNFLNTEYSTDAGFAGMATLLQRIPADKNIIVDCIGDELCVGARTAIQNAGRADQSMITAWGATPDAMVDLMNGDNWDFESANFFSSWGEFVAPMALAVAKGIVPPDQTLPPQTIITPKNAKDIFAEDGSVKMFPPLPDASSYLLDQGLIQQLKNVQGVE